MSADFYVFISLIGLIYGVFFSTVILDCSINIPIFLKIIFIIIIIISFFYRKIAFIGIFLFGLIIGYERINVKYSFKNIIDNDYISAFVIGEAIEYGFGYKKQSIFIYNTQKLGRVFKLINVIYKGDRLFFGDRISGIINLKHKKTYNFLFKEYIVYKIKIKKIINSKFSNFLKKIYIRNTIFLNDLGRYIFNNLVFGIKDYKSRWNNYFEALGLLPFIAISGLHFLIIFNILKWIFNKFNIDLYFTILFLSLNLLVVGFTTSVFRAWFMVILGIFINKLNRCFILMRILFLTSFIHILIFPEIIFTKAYFLSYLAVFIIAFFKDKVSKQLFLSLIIQGLLIPVLWLFFNKIYILSIIFVPVYSFYFLLIIIFSYLNFFISIIPIMNNLYLNFFNFIINILGFSIEILNKISFKLDNLLAFLISLLLLLVIFWLLLNNINSKIQVLLYNIIFLFSGLLLFDTSPILYKYKKGNVVETQKTIYVKAKDKKLIGYWKGISIKKKKKFKYIKKVKKFNFEDVILKKNVGKVVIINLCNILF